MAAAKGKKAPAKKAAPKKPKAEKKPEAEGFKTKKFDNYTVFQKRSGRFEVVGKNGKNINGMEKAKILVEAKLIKTGLAKKEAPATEAAAPAAE